MDKIKISNNAFGFPMPMTVIGSKINGKENYMAAAWVTRVNYMPPLIGVAVNKTHVTSDIIHENRQFSINVPGCELVKKVDYTGLVSGAKIDKSNVFEAFYGELENAPMIKSCGLTMECKLYNSMEFPTNIFFVGEIINAYTEEKYMTDGKPDIWKIQPFVLSMPDNRYFKTGEYIGQAWKAGSELKK